MFELSPPSSSGGAWTEQTLYSFLGGNIDGYQPMGGVAFDSSGNLYGTTSRGGTVNCDGYGDGCGTVYELIKPTSVGASWTEQILYNFNDFANLDGAAPWSSVLVVSSGQKVAAIYGTTKAGGEICYYNSGASACGGVFELTPSQPGGSWFERFYAAGNNEGSLADGEFVQAGLVRAPNGKLYGATVVGGTGQCYDDYSFTVGCGVIFEVTPPAHGSSRWNPVVLYNFTGLTDGASPLSTLYLDKEGNIYGTTSMGGTASGSCLNVVTGYPPNTCTGTIFELSPPTSGGSSWTETTLYNFAGNASGAEPHSGITPDGSGGFFGTTYYGGVENTDTCTYGCGTIFHLKP